MGFAYNILRKVSNLPGIKQIKKSIGRRKSMKRNQVFLAEGVDTLNHIDKVLRSQGINYCTVFGTMLGAVREHGFIKHDLDIDLAVWYDEAGESLKEILEKEGFTFHRSINVDNGQWGREETYYYKGVSIDFFYFYESDDIPEKWPYTTVFVMFPGYDNNVLSMEAHGGMMPIQLFLPLDRTVRYVSFETTQVPVPTNAEEFLAARYGQSWRIPDPTFVYPKMGDAKCAYREDKLGVISKA